jgi:hypothetical protein
VLQGQSEQAEELIGASTLTAHGGPLGEQLPVQQFERASDFIHALEFGESH